VLPSSKSIRRGDTVAKQVKEINKTKKKRRWKKIAQKSAQLMNTTTATTAHTSSFLLPMSRRRRSPSLASLRAAAPASVAVSPCSLSLCPLIARQRWCRVPCAGAGGGRGVAACGWWSREERGGGGAVGSISPPLFPSLTHSCCFLARRPGLF
jgi:hypothetical protein